MQQGVSIVKIEAKKIWPIFGIVVLAVTAVFLGSRVGSVDDTCLNQTSAHEILSKYQSEIDLLETNCGYPIEEISSTTRKEIASVANRYLYNSDYHFSELMTDIASAFALQEE